MFSFKKLSVISAAECGWEMCAIVTAFNDHSYKL